MRGGYSPPYLSISMITVRTTSYFKIHFGNIQSEMKSVGFIGKEEVFQYEFTHPDFLYEWLEKTSLSIKRGKIFKGNTSVGAYIWEKPNKMQRKIDSRWKIFLKNS